MLSGNKVNELMTIGSIIRCCTPLDLLKKVCNGKWAQCNKVGNESTSNI